MYPQLFSYAGVILLMQLLSVSAIYNDNDDYNNSTLDSKPESNLNISRDSTLWTVLFRECKKPTVSCVQKTIYHYLNDTLDYPNDFQVTDFIKFTKNSVDFGAIKKQIAEGTLNGTARGEMEEEEEEDTPRAMSPIQKMTSALHNKAVKFMMTHDMELKLPNVMFDGATLKVSPRSVDDEGAMVRLEVIPRELKEQNENSHPRIFFKKIKKAIGEKLMMALMAILMVIKLIAVKVLFFLPALVGVATAKKLILKFVLFVFPALSHIFKLCPYVPHGTKYHHHKHQIAHIHHVTPHHLPPPIHGHGHPPSIHHHTDLQLNHPGPSYNPHEDDLEFYADGPAFTHEFINHRKADGSQNKQVVESNELFPWFSSQSQKEKKIPTNRPLTPKEIENMVLKAEKEAVLKSRLQQEHLRVQAENLRLQQQIKQALKLQDKLKQSMMFSSKVRAPIQMTAPSPTLPALQNAVPTLPLPEPSPYLRTPAAPAPVQKQQELTPQNSNENFKQAVQMASTITYDPFYSPILAKIDKILVGLGYHDEPCRERLICSMYKNPPKFSPHSNLLSAELSRDASELQKPTISNAAVIRFYRYVQAARDGQDKRECLRLYPCAINTEI